MIAWTPSCPTGRSTGRTFVHDPIKAPFSLFFIYRMPPMMSLISLHAHQCLRAPQTSLGNTHPVKSSKKREKTHIHTTTYISGKKNNANYLWHKIIYMLTALWHYPGQSCVSRTQPSFDQTDDGVDAETSLSLSLHFYLSSPPLHFFLALTLGQYILFENACELQRVVLHLEELSRFVHWKGFCTKKRKKRKKWCVIAELREGY